MAAFSLRRERQSASKNPVVEKNGGSTGNATLSRMLTPPSGENNNYLVYSSRKRAISTGGNQMLPKKNEKKNNKMAAPSTPLTNDLPQATQKWPPSFNAIPRWKEKTRFFFFFFFFFYNFPIKYILSTITVEEKTKVEKKIPAEPPARPWGRLSFTKFKHETE